MSALPAANPLLRLWGAYSRSLQARPVVTKMTAAVLIFTASDLGTQYLTREIPMPPPSPPPPSPHAAGAKRRRAGEGAGTAAAPPPSLPSPPFAPDCRRALSAAAFGAVGTVYLHHWWNLLEVLVGARFPAGPGRRSRIASTAAKVAIDQALSAPLYNWGYFFVTNLVEGRDSLASGPASRAGAAASRATAMIGPLMLDHWRVWPGIHFLNFYFTPVANRVLVQNLVLVGWAGYLSHLNHTAVVPVAAAAAEEEEPDDGASEAAGDETARPRVRVRRRRTFLTGIDVVEKDL